MTEKDIRDRVEEIKESSQDDEAAHFLEDELYYDFIEYIAKTKCKDLQKKALAILETKKIDFARRYGC